MVDNTETELKVLEVELQGTLFDNTMPKEPGSGIKIQGKASKPMSPEIKVIKSPAKGEQRNESAKFSSEKGSFSIAAIE